MKRRAGSRRLVSDDRKLREARAGTSLGALGAMALLTVIVLAYLPAIPAGDQLWGPNPLGYHLLNVLLHALNAILLWQILKRLELPGAWAVAALFALHPVQVESVAWISESKNVLSTTLYLGALTCYLRFAGLDGSNRDLRVRQRLFAGALVLFLCALLTKAVTLTFPAVLLLLIWWKRGALSRQEVVPTLPFFSLSLILGLFAAWTERQAGGATGFQWSHGLLDRILIAGRAVWFYAIKLFWPDPIVSAYPRWNIDATDVRAYLFPVATLVVIFLLWRIRHEVGRGPLTAVLFFVVTLSPALGLVHVSHMRDSFVADRWQYLACVGLLAGLAAGARTGLNRSPRGALVGFLTLCAVLLGLGHLTWTEAAHYRDAETILRASLTERPRSFAAQNDLGSMLLQRGELAQAELHLRAAIRIQPDFPESHNNLGIVLHNQGRVEEAIAEYHEALRIYPEHADACNNLGISLAAQGDLDGALVQFETAVRLSPGFLNASRNLGTALLYLGRPAEAVIQFTQVLETDPQSADAWILLGDAQAAQEQMTEAVASYRKALRVAPEGSRFAETVRAKLEAAEERR